LLPVDTSLCFLLRSFASRFNRRTIEAGIQKTNTIYGGFNLEVTNVYSTHGELDPWRAMGVQSDLNKDAPAIVYPRKAFRLIA